MYFRMHDVRCLCQHYVNLRNKVKDKDGLLMSIEIYFTEVYYCVHLDFLKINKPILLRLNTIVCLNVSDKYFTLLVSGNYGTNSAKLLNTCVKLQSI